MSAHHHFDEARHLYTSHGKPMPSVSAVMDSIDTGKFNHIPAWRLQYAANRGIQVHRLCELWDKNKLVGMGESVLITEETAGYLAAWMKFCDDYQPVWDGIEERIFNDNLGLAGTLDRAGFAERLGLMIADIKTPLLTCPLWQLQTAGYKILKAAKDPKYATARRFTIQLRPNGRYQLDEHRCNQDIEVFKSQLNVINWLRNQGKIN